MKLLFLRGQVPQDRDPRQIMYDKLENNCDMWTQLCYEMIKVLGEGELWYWGGEREVNYGDNFIERWLPNFNKNDFNPDIIFARGGFSYYDDVLRRNPNAFKIYYGAGFRRIPGKKQFRDFNLILVDTPAQLAKAKVNLPRHNIQLLIKPAADNIFKPVCGDKYFDVIMVGNYNKGVNKGHDFAFPRIHKRYKVLTVGKIPNSVCKQYKGIKYYQWIPRKEIPKCYAQAKVAIVCCGKEDSCPRVIPEALACGCPLLVLDRVNFWKEKYIDDSSGMVTSKEDFIDNLRKMINKYDDFSPRDFYQNNISLEISSKRILEFTKMSLSG